MLKTMIEAFKEEPFTTTVVCLLFFSIPFGAFMALYTDNPWWWALCLPIFIFLS